MRRIAAQVLPRTAGISKDSAKELQQALAEALGVPKSALRRNGLQPALIRAYCEIAGDPDGILADWLETGAPLGVRREVSPTGVFPPVSNVALPIDSLEALLTQPAGWKNYRSAEGEPGVALGLLEKMVTNKWADAYDSWAGVA